MKKKILIVLFAICTISSYSISLKVGDPRNSWYTSQGTIESATYTVIPRGIYWEYDVVLTFSSKGTSWTTSKDTLEVALNFDLPENAIVFDSWLWIDGEPIRAKLFDRWTASSIYESIVRRRRDPSILSKNTSTNYDLKIFPMIGNDTRKVKIKYLVSANWQDNYVSANLPISFLKTSTTLPTSLYLNLLTDKTWVNPRVLNDSQIAFTSLGDTFKTSIVSSKYSSGITIAYDNPSQNGYFFSKYKLGNEGVYQLAVFPNKVFNLANNKKVIVLVDYIYSNTNLSSAELLTTIKASMLKNLSAADSFNVIFSNINVKSYSDKWILATKENIELAFENAATSLSLYSNLSSLLVSGVNFVKEHGNNGKIILIANSVKNSYSSTTNKYISDLIALMNPKIKINISDYQALSESSFNRHNYYYYNAYEYLYTNLTRQTQGEYFRLANDFLVSDCIDASFNNISESAVTLDIYTKLAVGFCNNRQNLNWSNNSAISRSQFFQFGKFKGDFPFKIEISGEFNETLLNKEISISESDAVIGDSIMEEVWTGQYIKSLELAEQTNNNINNIVVASLNERVLSKYTAFLCLEKTYVVCETCTDNNRLDFNTVTSNIMTDLSSLPKDSIKVYPNPFTDNLTIEFNSLQFKDIEKISIVNQSGILIYSFHANVLITGQNTITWNGRMMNDEIAKSGIYFLQVRTKLAQKTIKIVKK